MLLFYKECLVTHRRPSSTDSGGGDDPYYVEDSQEKNEHLGRFCVPTMLPFNVTKPYKPSRVFAVQSS